MARGNPNIPLSGTLADLATPFAQRKDRERQAGIDLTNLKTATQQQTINQQTIESNERTKKKEEDEAKKAKIQLVAMNTMALGDLLKQGKSREAGALMVQNIDAMEEMGMDTTQAARFAMLAGIAPQAASQFYDQHVLPAIQTAAPEIFRPKPVDPDMVENGQTFTQDVSGNVSAAPVQGYVAPPPDAASAGPSNVQEWNFYNGLSPADQEKYLTMKRANTAVNLGGSVVVPSQVAPGGAPQATFPTTLPPSNTPEVRGAQVAAEEAARTAAIPGAGAATTQVALDRSAQEEAQKRSFEAGTARSALDAAKTKGQQTLETIDQLLAHPGLATATGTSGSLDPRSFMPFFATEAKDAMAIRDVLQSKLFVEALQAMRATGATLGAVSNIEGDKLDQGIVSLRNSQTDAQFKSELEKLRGIVSNSMGALDAAYNAKYAGASTGDPELDEILRLIDSEGQ